MSLIKSPTVVRSVIPDGVHDEMVSRLYNLRFREPASLDMFSIGFEPVDPEMGGSLVAEFPGGMAWRIRMDQKILPSSVVAAEVDKRSVARSAEVGRAIGKKERAEIKEDVLIELTPKALVRTTANVLCLHLAAENVIIMNTTSSKMVDACASALAAAIPGLGEMVIMNKSGMRRALGKKLLQILQDPDCGAFGEFQPCDEVVLADEEKRKITIKMSNLQIARDGIKEALTSGFTVRSMGLSHEGLDFRVTDDLQLRSLCFPIDPDAEENMWPAQVALEAQQVLRTLRELWDLFAEEEAEDQGVEVTPEAARGIEKGDELKRAERSDEFTHEGVAA